MHSDAMDFAKGRITAKHGEYGIDYKLIEGMQCRNRHFQHRVLCQIYATVQRSVKSSPRMHFSRRNFAWMEKQALKEARKDRLAFSGYHLRKKAHECTVTTEVV